MVETWFTVLMTTYEFYAEITDRKGNTISTIGPYPTLEGARARGTIQKRGIGGYRVRIVGGKVYDPQAVEEAILATEKPHTQNGEWCECVHCADPLSR